MTYVGMKGVRYFDQKCVLEVEILEQIGSIRFVVLVEKNLSGDSGCVYEKGDKLVCEKDTGLGGLVLECIVASTGLR